MRQVGQATLIADALERQGISLYAFGKAIGLRSQDALTRIGRGTFVLRDPQKIARASQLLGIPADALYIAADDIPPDVRDAIRRHPDVLFRVIRLASQRLED